jgi:hypothetical protein
MAFGAEERDRADVSELLYSGRGLSTHGRKAARVNDLETGVHEI